MLDNDTHLCGTINRKRCNYSKAIVLEELENGVAVFFTSQGNSLHASIRLYKTKIITNQKLSIPCPLHTLQPWNLLVWKTKMVTQ